jgi:ABC-type nitrate/sulfonate/bicarbonate transport system substrate-binding protein
MNWLRWIGASLIGGAITVMHAQALAQPARKVTMGLAGQSMIASIPRFAKEMGLFEKRGVDVTFVTLDSANASATALLAGSVEVAFSGPVELITARSRGRDVVAIANTYGGLGGSLVLSKSVADKLGVAANAPITERMKALKGLTIASPSATSAYTVTYKAAAGAAGADVKFTYMAMPAMLAAMESGAIQGYVASAPFWVPPVVGGTGVLWVAGPRAELPAEVRPRSNSVLLTMRDTAKANPEMIRSLQAVFADFVEAIDKRPAEVKAAVVKVFPNVDSRTRDVLFDSESLAWKARPLTPADITHEIAYTKLGGASLPQLDGADPAAMLWP